MAYPLEVANTPVVVNGTPLTERIEIIVAIKPYLYHPVVLAKMALQIEIISRGRFGINVVCGWNQDEFSMFGAEQRAHDARYDYADEWLAVIEGLWSSAKPFDFDGRYFKLNNVVGNPKPFDNT